MQDGFHILQILLLLVTLCLSAARSETLSSGEDVAGYVTRKIAEADVMVFAKSYCPHCRASRTLLHKLHDDGDHSWTLDIVDLDLMEDNDGPYVQMELLKQSGQRTVPNIYIHGMHIGGNSDLQELFENGDLESMLEQVEL